MFFTIMLNSHNQVPKQPGSALKVCVHSVSQNMWWLLRRICGVESELSYRLWHQPCLGRTKLPPQFLESVLPKHEINCIRKCIDSPCIHPIFGTCKVCCSRNLVATILMTIFLSSSLIFRFHKQYIFYIFLAIPDKPRI